MSASHLPQLRTDLELRQQETSNGTILIIKDPASGEFFRLSAGEAFIARQCNGETPLDVIQRRVQSSFGASLASHELTEFIKSLDRAGLLENERGERARNRTHRPRRQGGTLYMRYRVVDPDRVLDWLMPRTRFCFTPAFVVLSALLITLAVSIGIFNWDHILQGSLDLVRLSTLPLLVVTIFIALTAHEFAHGLTCKHFGGEVREMGFMLLYFQPAFYCNVSDAWLFPEKRKRLWVGFAGPYFELFLWALATICWRVTAVDTWINEASLVLMATSGIKTLFNFIPLIKLDGYYLLSDYLEIPNLRQKSFQYLGNLIKRVAGLRRRMPRVSRREHRIYLTYGVTALIFSVSLLLFIAGSWGEYLIVERQRLAFLALTALVGIRLRILLRKLFRSDSRRSGSGRSRSSSRESGKGHSDQGGLSIWQIMPAPFPPRYLYAGAGNMTMREDSDTSRPDRTPAGQDATTSGSEDGGTASDDSRRPSRGTGHSTEEAAGTDGHTESAADKQVASGNSSSGNRSPRSGGSGSSGRDSSERRSRRRRRRRWRWIRRWSLRLAAAGAVAVLLFAVRIELRIAGPVDILPHHNADVRTDIEGTVAEVFVSEGKQVDKGDIIARLYDSDTRAELEKVRAEIDKAKAKLDQLAAGPTREEIEVARSAVASASRQLEFARVNLTRTKKLFERDVVSRKEYDAARETVAKGENELSEAESKLQVLLAGTREEEIRAARAELERLHVQRQYLEGQVQDSKVRSPASGVVTTPTRQLQGLLGKTLSKGDLIAKVHELETITVETTISEKEIADVKIGQTIGIKPRAYPDRVFYGKVQDIASTTVGANSAQGDGSDQSSSSNGTSKSIRITTELDNSSGLLKPGMTGMAKVYCGERRIIDLIIRRLSRTFRVEFWSWW